MYMSICLFFLCHHIHESWKWTMLSKHHGFNLTTLHFYSLEPSPDCTWDEKNIYFPPYAYLFPPPSNYAYPYQTFNQNKWLNHDHLLAWQWWGNLPPYLEVSIKIYPGQNHPSCIYTTKQFHWLHIHPHTDHTATVWGVKLPDNCLCGWTVWYGLWGEHRVRWAECMDWEPDGELKRPWCKVTMQFHCFQLNWEWSSLCMPSKLDKLGIKDPHKTWASLHFYRTLKENTMSLSLQTVLLSLPLGKMKVLETKGKALTEQNCHEGGLIPRKW